MKKFVKKTLLHNDPDGPETARQLEITPKWLKAYNTTQYNTNLQLFTDDHDQFLVLYGLIWFYGV
jgi:hypothetical protein